MEDINLSGILINWFPFWFTFFWLGISRPVPTFVLYVKMCVVLVQINLILIIPMLILKKYIRSWKKLSCCTLVFEYVPFTTLFTQHILNEGSQAIWMPFFLKKYKLLCWIWSLFYNVFMWNFLKLYWCLCISVIFYFCYKRWIRKKWLCLSC